MKYGPGFTQDYPDCKHKMAAPMGHEFDVPLSNL